MNSFNEYPYFVIATVYIANGIPLDYKIGERERDWHDKTFRGFYFWERYVWNNFDKLKLECKYKKIQVNNNEEHSQAFKTLENWVRSGKYD